jgi:GNAT superfamily N-acetyltransferase
LKKNVLVCGVPWCLRKLREFELRSAGKRVVIRRATVRDLDMLVRHRRAMWEETGRYDISTLQVHDRRFREWVRERLRSGKLLGWVAEINGDVVGGACVWLQPTRPRPSVRGTTVPYLLSMYTEPKFRGRGIGARILNEVIKWATRKHYSRIVLHASKKARPLYLRHGFKRTLEMALNLR